jgi:hypothetical protein
MNIEARSENARLVGKLLALSGGVLAAAAAAAALGWFPMSDPMNRAMTIILTVTSAADLLFAMFFLARYRQ